MLKFRRFWGNERGAVAHIFAITFMLLLAIIGFGIDMSSSVNEKEKLRSAADMAAIATARALLSGEITEREAEDFAKKSFGQIAAGYGAGGNSAFGKISFKANVDIQKTTKDGQTTYKVKVYGTAKVPASPMSVMLRDGNSSENVMNVGFNSESTARADEPGAFSMALVLDKSGSMGWNRPTRMSNLKIAVASLVSELKDVDQESRLVRLGAYAYDSYFYGKRALTWDKDAVRFWTYQLSAGGGTAAHTTIQQARIDLISQNEQNAHSNKNGQTPQLFMLYMTDGDDFRKSQAISECDNAKRAGVIVYTVAFQAPSSGKKLLKECASSNKHYYDAKDANELNKVFKAIAKEAAASVLYVSG